MGLTEEDSEVHDYPFKMAFLLMGIYIFYLFDAVKHAKINATNIKVNMVSRIRVSYVLHCRPTKAQVGCAFAQVNGAWIWTYVQTKTFDTCPT